MVLKYFLPLLFILNISIAYAQCTSSTGAPIVSETFGSGTNFGPHLPAGATTLQYVADKCPEDGEYTIANSTSNCYGGVWHTIKDHTGDNNGYFMLVNASYQPSDFYVKTVDGLCAGTTYAFSSWVINMFTTEGAILPNITFTVEKTNGIVLATYNTGDIPVTNPATWEKYGFYFKTPDGVSKVVIRMHNNASGGVGNDLAIDDIGFSPAGPTTIISVPGLKNDTLYNFCFNKNISLMPVIGNCYTQNSYQWQSSTNGVTWANIPQATDAEYTFTVQKQGTELFRLSVAEEGNIGYVNCRVNSNTITVVSARAKTTNIDTGICLGDLYILPSGTPVNKSGLYHDTLRSVGGCDSLITNLNLTIKDSPHPDLGPDLNLCFGDTVTLNPGTFSSYLWQDNSTLPYYKIVKGGTYWVRVSNDIGCEGIDTVVITVANCSAIKIPNTFSPNNDGINDTWKIDQLNIYDDCSVQIFNRYGQLIFHTKGEYIPWDGKINGKNAPVGTYYYIIDVPDVKQKFTGWLLLVR